MQGRGGLGIKVAKIDEARGDLVGGLIVDDGDEVLVVLASGKVVRSGIDEVPAKGRNTMGVVFARFPEGDRIIGIARNTERGLDDGDSEGTDGEVPAGAEGVDGGETAQQSGEAPQTENKEDVNE